MCRSVSALSVVLSYNSSVKRKRMLRSCAPINWVFRTQVCSIRDDAGTQHATREPATPGASMPRCRRLLRVLCVSRGRGKPHATQTLAWRVARGLQSLLGRRFGYTLAFHALTFVSPSHSSCVCHSCKLLSLVSSVTRTPAALGAPRQAAQIKRKPNENENESQNENQNENQNEKCV